MKWHIATMVSLVFVLQTAPVNTALADDEDYVKIEIKGILILYTGGPIPGGVAPDGQPSLLLKVGRQPYYGLNLKNMPGGPPPEKQLKEWYGQRVIVEGRLTIEQNGHPRVEVTRIASFKEPGPIMN